MDVKIAEVKSGRLLVTYSIMLGGLNYTPSEEEFFAQAWKDAVADNLVDASQRGQYVIEFVRGR